MFHAFKTQVTNPCSGKKGNRFKFINLNYDVTNIVHMQVSSTRVLTSSL